jgi:hypothetical protein
MPWKRGQRLHLVAPEDACLETAEVYAEMQAALGIPHIDKLHQAYGVHPEFLKAHWNEAQKIVGSEQFFSCADRLAADAYTRAHSYLSVPDLDGELEAVKVSAASREEIRQCLDLFHRRSTYSMLLCAWQRRAFDGPVGEGAAIEREAIRKDPHLPIIMRSDSMPPTTKKTLEEVRKRNEDPALDDFYFAISRWPDLLQDFWRGIQKEMASPMYSNCKQEVRAYAAELCGELPGPLELTTVQLLEVMDEAEIGSMVRITEAFERSYSTLVLNVAWTKIGIEGGNSARRSRRNLIEEPTSQSAS